MKRWLTGSLLVVLAGVLLLIVINSNRDPIAVLLEFGALNEKYSGGRTIERNGKGEVVGVHLNGACISGLRAGPSHICRNIITGRNAERKFSDADLVHLKDLTNLRSLSLSSTKVTDTGLVHLKGMTNLKSLHLLIAARSPTRGWCTSRG